MVVSDDFLFKLLLFFNASSVWVFDTFSCLAFHFLRVLLFHDSLGSDEPFAFLNERLVVSSATTDLRIWVRVEALTTSTIGATEIGHKVLSLSKSLRSAHT